MPELDGYETTKLLRLKEDDQHHSIIIAMTANAMKGEREKCIKAGMDDYISKPVELDHLKIILQKWQEYLSESKISSLEASPNIYDRHQVPINFAKINEFVKNDWQFRQELFITFLEDAAVYLKKIKQAILQQNFDQIIYHAHQLKGISSMIALYDLPELAHLLETQAQANQLENETELILKMEKILEKFRDFVSQESSNSINN